QAVIEAAYNGFREAVKRIDMRRHHGTHPRHGAVDVCPFVPQWGLTRSECAQYASALARRVGEFLRIPVYLYEDSAQSEARRHLSQLRAGEYEGIAQKLALLVPDYGPQTIDDHVRRTGISVIGARDTLIAYNIHLRSNDIQTAGRIAADLRTSGRILKDAHGKPLFYDPSRRHMPCPYCETLCDSTEALQAHCLLQHNFDWAGYQQEIAEFERLPLGTIRVRRPGALRACKAIAWHAPSYGCVQISTNLVHPDITPPHVAYQTCQRIAEHYGIEVDGSEIIGRIPLRFLIEAGLHAPGPTTQSPPSTPDTITAAIRTLGLETKAPFSYKEKVLDLSELIPS
ncbi:MAG: glutamate formimidoyltransferase, partial [Proteobacteria bacterium]|nr:glutamate formimidoyltransferase [Pseudomonadota bacterium]